MSVSTSVEYGHSIHYVRNLIGRVTYGLIGLDKLLQGERNESKPFLNSFLSLVESGPVRARTRDLSQSPRLLPEVEDTIRVYDPKMREELLSIADSVRKLTQSSNKTQIEEAYDQLESLLDKLYERTSSISKPNSLD